MVRASITGGCLAFLLIVPATVACQRPKVSIPPRMPAQTAEPFTTILSTDNSGITGVERAVIRDSADWAQMWGRLMEMRPIPPPLPAVDFDSAMVFVAASGQSAGGTLIRIVSIRVRSNEMVVYVRQSMSGVGCMGDMAIHYPAHVIEVQRLNKPVRFVNESVITSRCGGEPSSKSERQLRCLVLLDCCLTRWRNTGANSQPAVCQVEQAQEDSMTRPLFSPSTLPARPRPDPLLLFIQQAQLILLYRERASA